jgi:peptidoglycan/LPS O-acetylase OafA/YrhL
MKKKYQHIEILRFFSALMVVTTHYIHFFNPFYKSSNLNVYKGFLEFDSEILPFYSLIENIYRFGYVGVYFFWLISGFVLAHTYLNHERYKINFKDFFVNRFARLYPLHVLTLLMVLLLQFFLKIETNTTQIIGNEIYNGENNLKSFFSHLFFISGWIKESKFSYNFPIWSVSIEIVIYFLFFLSLQYLFKFRLLLSFIIFIIFLALEKNNIDLFFISCGRYFFSGVFLFILCNKIKNLNYILWISLLLLLLNFIGNFKYNLFFSSLILLAFFLDHKTTYKFQNFYSKLGNLTYGSYLLHVPLQLSIIFIFSRFKFYDDVFSNGYFFIGYLIIIFYLSHISFKFFENPMRSYLKKLFK